MNVQENATLWYEALLACPQCKKPLSNVKDFSYSCGECGTEYGLGPMKQPDLRLPGPYISNLETKYDPALIEIPDDIWRLPDTVVHNLTPATKIDGRPQTDLKAWLLEVVKPGSVVLDLGGKSNRDERLIQSLGGKYVAVEIAAPDAMILGDAHAIPLLNESVDVVLCMSVFEHLKNPFLAASEIYRILKPGGVLVGIVGFIESVHGLPHGSYFHHSYLGVWTVLASTGFCIRYLTPGWSAIHAVAYAMFPGLPKRLSKLLVAPLRYFQYILWSLYTLYSGNKKNFQMKDRILAASFHFVAIRTD